MARATTIVRRKRLGSSLGTVEGTSHSEWKDFEQQLFDRVAEALRLTLDSSEVGHEEFARRVGLNRATLSYILNGRRNVSLALLANIGHELGITFDIRAVPLEPNWQPSKPLRARPKNAVHHSHYLTDFQKTGKVKVTKEQLIEALSKNDLTVYGNKSKLAKELGITVAYLRYLHFKHGIPYSGDPRFAKV